MPKMPKDAKQNFSDYTTHKHQDADVPTTATHRTLNVRATVVPARREEPSATPWAPSPYARKCEFPSEPGDERLSNNDIRKMNSEWKICETFKINPTLKLDFAIKYNRQGLLTQMENSHPDLFEDKLNAQLCDLSLTDKTSPRP